MVLDRYSSINSAKLNIPIKEKPKTQSTALLQLPNDTVNITLADQTLLTKNYVTVHNFADYRRKQSTILLVPAVKVSLDNFLFSREEVRKCIPIL